MRGKFLAINLRRDKIVGWAAVFLATQHSLYAQECWVRLLR